MLSERIVEKCARAFLRLWLRNRNGNGRTRAGFQLWLPYLTARADCHWTKPNDQSWKSIQLDLAMQTKSLMTRKLCDFWQLFLDMIWYLTWEKFGLYHNGVYRIFWWKIYLKLSDSHLILNISIKFVIKLYKVSENLKVFWKEEVWLYPIFETEFGRHFGRIHFLFTKSFRLPKFITFYIDRVAKSGTIFSWKSRSNIQ